MADESRGHGVRVWQLGVILAGAVALIGLASIPLLPLIVGTAEPRPLVESKSRLPAEDNAYPGMLQALRVLHPQGSRYRANWSSEVVMTSFSTTEGWPLGGFQIPEATDPVADRLMAQLSPVYAAMDEALARPSIWPVTVVDGGDDSDAIYTSSLGDLGQLMAFRGDWLFARGRPIEGLHQFRELLRFGYCPASAWMGGAGFRAAGLAGLRRHLGEAPKDKRNAASSTARWPRQGWSDAELAAWRQALSSVEACDYLPILRSHLNNTLEPWRWTTRYQPPPRDRQRDRRGYELDTVATTAFIQSYYAAALDATQQTGAKRDLAAVRAILDNPPWPSFYNQGSIKAVKQFAQTTWPEKVLAPYDTATLHQRATAAMIAIMLFNEAEGRLPGEWSELVAAGLLSEPPVDPASGMTVDYRPDEGVLILPGPPIGPEIERRRTAQPKQVAILLEKAKAAGLDPATARLDDIYVLSFVTDQPPEPWYAPAPGDAERVSGEMSWLY